MGRLFWKIFAAFWVALILAAAAAGTGVWLRQHPPGPDRELAQGSPQALVTELAAATLKHGGVAALREWANEAASRRPLTLLAVDASGADFLSRPVPAGALARAREVAASEPGSRAVRTVTAPGGERWLLFVPNTGQMQQRPPPPPSAWLLLAIGAVVSLAVSALLAWYLARPIRSLRWAFDAVAGGRLDTRVRSLMGSRRDEIADLGVDFDRMVEQLQSLVAAQRRLLHDVSHELRSPLARLQAAVGLARQDRANLDAALERIEREAVRLDEMVGEVLALARAEAGAPSEAVREIDLAEILDGIVADAHFEARASERRVEWRHPERLAVSGRASLLHRALENVVRNALKHTAPGTAVEIDLEPEAGGGTARVVVRDRGPGVPPDSLERIFEPFYRGARQEATAPAGGFGLGLAISQAAIVAHGGSIRCANRAGGGLEIEIVLPRGACASTTVSRRATAS